MPYINRFDFMKPLENPTKIIFTTVIANMWRRF